MQIQGAYDTFSSAFLIKFLVNSMNKETIDKTAELARLRFDDAQTEKLGQELTAIFDLFHSINTSEISALSPLSHPLELSQALRSDVAVKREMIPSLEINAPDFAHDFIKVPKVIE